nr:AAA family ATPase [Bradyrhizobium diazoefficiens]
MKLRAPALIVFGGLPGTGKTTVARELTQRLAATYLRIDTIEQTLRSAGLAVGVMDTPSRTLLPLKISSFAAPSLPIA